METRQQTESNTNVTTGRKDNIEPEPIATNRRERMAAVPADSRTISGIDLIDFGTGGLQQGQPYFVRGGLGMGKTVLGLQFLARGIELGEPAILVTRQNPESVLKQASGLGMNIEDAVRRGQLIVLRPTGDYFDLVESPADVTAIAEELADYAKESGAQRMVIDPVYAMITTSFSSHFAVTIAQSLLNALEELPMTTLLIGGDDDNPDLTPIVRVLEQNTAGVIELTPDQATGGRMMRLRKMRHASDENLAAHYRILDGRGLINYRGEGEIVSDVTKPWEDSATLRRSVLVLGSNPETIRRVREALGEDYQITAESDYRKGIERAKSDHPGLVIVTPGRSLDAVTAVIDLSRRSDSAVAFLSPNANRAADKSFYLRSGADDFISEPFAPDEFRARVEALIRRSGRRLVDRDSSLSSVSADELLGLYGSDVASGREAREVLHTSGDGVRFDPTFREKLKRNLDTVSALDMNFALYWLKAKKGNGKLNRELSRLCRQEDILCRNSHGEFVALLTGADESGVKGFENRLDEKLGAELSSAEISRGYSLYTPGEPLDSFAERTLQA